MHAIYNATYSFFLHTRAAQMDDEAFLRHHVAFHFPPGLHYYSKEAAFDVPMAWIVPNDAPFLPIVNKHLRRMLEVITLFFLE